MVTNKKVYRGATCPRDHKRQIDSLKVIIKSEIPDTSKIIALVEWSNAIYSSDPELEMEILLEVIRIGESRLKQINKGIEYKLILTDLVASYTNLGLNVESLLYTPFFVPQFSFS